MGDFLGLLLVFLMLGAGIYVFRKRKAKRTPADVRGALLRLRQEGMETEALYRTAVEAPDTHAAVRARLATMVAERPDDAGRQRLETLLAKKTPRALEKAR